VRDAARQAERARIIQALQQVSGNRVKAARLLKISRASLYNKLHEYGIR
jgi:two-component system response regulator AtoC